jgi:chemotaxis protein MotB
MARRRQRRVDLDEGENFWPSFADLTSTIALIFFVLMLLAYAQNLIAGKQLQSVKSDLARTLSGLANARRDVDAAQKRLNLLGGQIALSQAELRVSADKLAAQEGVIATSQRELETLRARLQSISVLRMEVLNKVKDALEAELKRGPGTPSQVVVADNGNIVIHESLVFESDSYAIKRAARPLLDTLASAFANVLSDPEVRDTVDVILIQGHTDERGGVAYNRELSAKRAGAVLDHLFAASPVLSERYGSLFASTAYSEFRPRAQGASEAAYAQNRRIEISLVLRDSSARALIDEYMQNLAPKAP